MATRTPRRQYRPTESKYKGGAQEFYLTYDLEQPTRGGGTAVYPRVKRVYLSGDIRDWAVGRFTKKSGKTVHCVRIAYEQTRGGYHRRGYRAHLGRTAYTVPPTTVKEAR